jgi:hypothetical protein
MWGAWFVRLAVVRRACIRRQSKSGETVSFSAGELVDTKAREIYDPMPLTSWRPLGRRAMGRNSQLTADFLATPQD